METTLTTYNFHHNTKFRTRNCVENDDVDDDGLDFTGEKRKYYNGDKDGDNKLYVNRGRSKSVVPSECPLQMSDLEKSWFLYSSRCNLSQMTNILEKDYQLVNKKGYFTGFAALHWAAKKGRIDVVEWLMDQGADVSICSNGGHSPLHISTMHNQTTIVKKLINDFNADINIRDYSGRKARHYISRDLPMYIQTLLEKTPSIEDLSVDPTYRRAIPAVLYRQEPSIACWKSKSPVESLKKKKRKISVPSLKALKYKKHSATKREMVEPTSSCRGSFRRKSISAPDVFSQITYPYTLTSAEI